MAAVLHNAAVRFILGTLLGVRNQRCMRLQQPMGTFCFWPLKRPARWLAPLLHVLACMITVPVQSCSFVLGCLMMHGIEQPFQCLVCNWTGFPTKNPVQTVRYRHCCGTLILCHLVGLWTLEKHPESR